MIITVFLGFPSWNFLRLDISYGSFLYVSVSLWCFVLGFLYLVFGWCLLFVFLGVLFPAFFFVSLSSFPGDLFLLVSQVWCQLMWRWGVAFCLGGCRLTLILESMDERSMIGDHLFVFRLTDCCCSYVAGWIFRGIVHPYSNGLPRRTSLVCFAFSFICFLVVFLVGFSSLLFAVLGNFVLVSL